jgi:hypothetical protein
LEFTKSLLILKVSLENSLSKSPSKNSKGFILKGAMDLTQEINPKRVYPL